MKKWLLLILFLSPSLLCEEIPVVKAKYQETLKDKHVAREEVTIEIGETRIHCDEMEYHFEKKTLIARGNVVLDMPGQSITAKEILLNLDEKTGEMKDVFILNEQGLFLKADHLKKESENVYRLKNSSLTSCTQPNPRWSIHLNKGKLKKDDYVDMWGVKFKIKNFPVLYLPYLRYPLPKEGRKTGFLMPLIGYSELKGFSISEAFFWALSRSSDLTLQGEYFSNFGEGISAELRWRTYRGFGNGKLYYFFYNDGKRDYHANLNMREELPLNFLLTAEVNRQSTFNFFKQFMNDFNLYSQSVTSSSVNISKSIGVNSFYLRIDRNESYLSGASIITSRTPQIKFSRLNTRFTTLPLFFSFDSIIENFSRKDSNSSISFPFFYFSPSLSFNLSLAPWLSFSNETIYKFDYYGKSYNTEERNYSDKAISRNFAFARFNIVGPSLYRIFQSGDLKLKHVIEPRIVYSLSTRYKESSFTSPFETRYPLPVNELSLNISNKFLKKIGKGTPSELLFFDISQSFYFDSSRDRAHSNINGTLRFVISPTSFMEYRTSFNPDKRGFESSLLSLNYSPSSGNLLKISWSKTKRIEGERLKTSSDQARFFILFKIPSISVDFAGDTNYDFYSKKMLSFSYRLGYNYQCLNFSFEYLYFMRADRKRDYNFRFNIGFANIGLVQDMLGGRGF